MSRNTEITKPKFYSINRDIKAAVVTNSYDAIRIARKQSVSAETVRAVRRAGTWPKWQHIKAERNQRRVERAKAAAQGGDFSTPPQILAIDTDNDDQEEDMVTIPRSLFAKCVLLDRRVKSLEDWRAKEREAEKAMIKLALNDEPKQKSRFWSKR